MVISGGDPPAVGNAHTITWEVRGDSSALDHSEVHYGPASIPDPEAGVYPSTATGLGSGAGRYTAQATMPPGGVLYARAHVTGAGKTVWSSELTLGTPRTGPGFQNVEVTQQPQAGVPAQISYRLVGEGTTNHVGSHFSSTSSASLPPGFQPGDWTGLRTSQHLGTPPVTLPADVRVNLTFPTPGTWYVRPHTLLNGAHLWGDQVTVQVGIPERPNIVLLSGSPPAVAGTPMMVTFAVNAAPGMSGHVGAHYSVSSSAALPPGFSPGEWPGQRASPHQGAPPVMVPGTFSTNITFPLPGAWRYRPHAIVGDQSVWGDEVVVAVAPPAQNRVVILGAPANHTFSLVPGGVSPIQVEWTVLTPVGGLTNHTHIHHGPNSVAQPAERSPGYPAFTEPFGNASVPAIFRANITLPQVQGPYYLRAMALVPGDDGQPVEAWSDEWVVNVSLRTP